jgi:hypothetical protein
MVHLCHEVHRLEPEMSGAFPTPLIGQGDVPLSSNGEHNERSLVGREMVRLAETVGNPIEVFLPYLGGTQDEKQLRVVMDRERWFQVLMGADYRTDEPFTEKAAERIPCPSLLRRHSRLTYPSNLPAMRGSMKRRQLVRNRQPRGQALKHRRSRRHSGEIIRS